MNEEENEFYARRFLDDAGNQYLQTLTDHLQNVAELARTFAESFGGGELSYAAGKYHDSAKGNAEFQSYLFDEKAHRGSVQHSIPSAKRIYANLAGISLPLAELMANVVAAHHGRLYDFVSPDGSTPLAAKLNLAPEDSFPSFSLNTDALLPELQKSLSMASDKPFAMFMLTKLIYSCLVDADRLDAHLFESQQTYEEFCEGEKIKPNWVMLQEALEKYLSQLTDNSEMAVLRRDLSEQCAESGQRERGIYQLEAPTGGGKTLASLRFALAHAKEHDLDRIIYVIPYLSILSQTVDSIREALGVGEDIVFEHSSNIITDDIKYYKLHTGRWDKPIILTTQVQFLESIFSAHGSDLRKLHSMANSILIFDEVQSLPVKSVHLFNSAINFLQRVCRSTILLCTATQPLLNKVRRPILLSEHPSIAQCHNAPRRTKIVNLLTPAGYTYAELSTLVQSKHQTSTLIIVNTKSAAKSLYNELKSAGLPVMHLSTNMCSAHRESVIAELRQRLTNHEPVICISTQLIEAGVDISFECVFRDLAGLDSIWQAAGRCNRHGEFGDIKPVYVVNIKGENLSKLRDIKKGVEITRRLFHENRLDDMDEYYKQYFFAQSDIMDYPVSGGTIYDLLSTNCQGRLAYQNRGNTQEVELCAAFRSAAADFYVIDRGREDVIVPYGKSLELFQAYLEANDVVKKSQLLQQLSKYSVSLYKFQSDELKRHGALSEEGGVTVLRGFYDAELGVDSNGSHEFLWC